METKKELSINRFIGKLFGGLSMSWLNVILFAVGTAVLTAIFLVVPIFEDTSFELVGVTFEAWIFFAVIIMANCKKPLESALKTFVFFLISQPLVFLVQPNGFDILGRYYGFWFLMTLCTFPGAWLGWYTRQNNLRAALLLSVMLVMLTVHCYHYLNRPRMHLLSAVFCFVQIIALICGILKEKKLRYFTALFTGITAGILLLIESRL